MLQQLSRNRLNILVFLAAALLTAAVAAAFLASVGIDDDAFGLALRRSAHASFLLLVVVFVARPLAQLYPSRMTSWLLHNRHRVVTAFAGIHSAHLGLIVSWDRLSPTFEFIPTENIAGGLVYLAIAAMLVMSFDGPDRRLERKRYRILYNAALYFIFVAFLPTLVPESRSQLFGANGLLISIAAAAVFVRVLAFVRNRRLPEQRPT